MTMTQAIASVPAATTTGAVSQRATRATRVLLACGMTAGPLFVSVVVAQGLTRKGFDFTRHAASLLSNGNLGWIQITNFVLTGAATIAFAAGMRRVLRTGPGATWGPRLVRVFGLGVLAAAFFRADPPTGSHLARPRATAARSAGTACCTSPAARWPSSR